MNFARSLRFGVVFWGKWCVLGDFKGRGVQ